MPEQTSLPSSTIESLRDLPPSAKLVAKTLEYEGSLTQGELADETMLPSRTVRHALTMLEDEAVVTSRISFTDARQRVYRLAEAAPESDGDPSLAPTS
ncbi:MAG: winged helix-turn-helix domain-containing protein [Haloarculaceae archaeon]